MPELPEVETVRAGLEKHVVGRTVATAEVLNPRAVRRDLTGPDGFAAAMAGRTLLRAERRGKYLWFALDDGWVARPVAKSAIVPGAQPSHTSREDDPPYPAGCAPGGKSRHRTGRASRPFRGDDPPYPPMEALLAHLGMSGQLLVGDPDRPLSAHVRARFTFTDGGPDLRFTDQRTFGHLMVCRFVTRGDDPPGDPPSHGGALPPHCPPTGGRRGNRGAPRAVAGVEGQGLLSAGGPQAGPPSAVAGVDQGLELAGGPLPGSPGAVAGVGEDQGLLSREGSRSWTLGGVAGVKGLGRRPEGAAEPTVPGAVPGVGVPGAGTGPRRLVPEPIAHIAPDPLEEAFDPALFAARLARKKTQVKRALLDQSLISGIGNIYADEALWRAELHWTRPADTLKRAEVSRLLESVRDVLTEALKAGGTSFDALYVNVNGESGYFDRSLNVYGREGEPCGRCTTPIRRESFMNRSSYTCPRCQR